MVAIPVKVSPSQIGTARIEFTHVHGLGGKSPTTVLSESIVAQNQKRLRGGNVVDDAVAKHCEIEVTIRIDIRRCQRSDPEVAVNRGAEVAIIKRRDFAEGGQGRHVLASPKQACTEHRNPTNRG